MSDSDDFSKLDDPAFLAEWKRVRGELDREPSPELTARYQQLNNEFDRRAGIAWASAS
jgi:hypothetical protein